MTEQEKIQELLKPRYKVIALWPNTEYKVGDILTPDYYIVKTIKWCESFPHLFKRLKWYEDRKPEEMPEYVRYSDWYLNHYHLGYEFKEKVFRVIKVDTGNYGIRIYIADDDRKYVESFYPATLTEYQQYINSKQQP